MKKLLVVLLFPLSALAQGGKEYKIKGTYKTVRPVDKIYLRYTSGEQSVMDSVQPKDGEYKFEGKISEPVVEGCILNMCSNQEKPGKKQKANLY